MALTDVAGFGDTRTRDARGRATPFVALQSSGRDTPAGRRRRAAPPRQRAVPALLDRTTSDSSRPAGSAHIDPCRQRLCGCPAARGAPPADDVSCGRRSAADPHRAWARLAAPVSSWVLGRSSCWSGACKIRFVSPTPGQWSFGQTPARPRQYGQSAANLGAKLTFWRRSSSTSGCLRYLIASCATWTLAISLAVAIAPKQSRS